MGDNKTALVKNGMRRFIAFLREPARWVFHAIIVDIIAFIGALLYLSESAKDTPMYLFPAYCAFIFLIYVGSYSRK